MLLAARKILDQDAGLALEWNLAAFEQPLIIILELVRIGVTSTDGSLFPDDSIRAYATEESQRITRSICESAESTRLVSERLRSDRKLIYSHVFFITFLLYDL